MGFGGAGGQKLIVSVAPELMHSATTEEVAEIICSNRTRELGMNLIERRCRAT